jgi:hypothetical protein
MRYNAVFFISELDMAGSNAFALRRSGLDEFLYASVGTEPSGMALSVLSVFARLGNDPWMEAGKLVGVPTGEAINTLAQSITAMPRTMLTLPDATVIATRLIALLPTRLGSAAQEPSKARRPTVRAVRICLLLTGVMFGIALASGQFTTHHVAQFDGSGFSTTADPLTPQSE